MSQMSPHPAPARPIFSSEDFKLLKRAVHAYLLENADAPDSSKFSHLYHRLGRAGR